MAGARNYLNYAHISFLLFQAGSSSKTPNCLWLQSYWWTNLTCRPGRVLESEKPSSELLSNLAWGCDHLKPFVKWFPNSRNSRWSRHHQSWGRTQGQNQNRPLLGKSWQIFSHIMWPLSKSYFQQNNGSVVNWTLSGRDQDYVVTPLPPSKSAWNAINRGGCVQLC